MSMKFLLAIPLVLSSTFAQLDTIQPWTNWTTTGLSDRESIQQTLSLYCVAVDTKSWSLFTQIFTENANASYDATTPTLLGLAQIQAYLNASVAGKTSQHLLGTQLINIAADGASANATTYVQATLGADPRLTVGQVIMLYGFYNDRLVKEEQGWKINDRVLRLYGPQLAGNTSLIGM